MTNRPGRGDAWFIGMALGCLAAVALALASQYGYGMQPCPWCVLQRLIFVAIALVALVALAWRRRVPRQVAALTAVVLSLSGIAAALWQHFKAAASASCNLTFADRVLSSLRLDSALPSVFEPRASCADAAVKLAGIPYDVWSLALFAALLVAALAVLRRFRAPSQ